LLFSILVGLAGGQKKVGAIEGGATPPGHTNLFVHSWFILQPIPENFNKSLGGRERKRERERERERREENRNTEQY